MLKDKMSSKERIITTIKHEKTDHIPLCFDGVGHQSVEFVNRLYPDPFERAKFYLDLETDTAIKTGPPLFSNKGFETRQWKEQPSDEPYPLLIKEYITPKGNLKQIIRKHDYPFESVGIFNDHHVPQSRSVKYLIEREEDLEKLEYILTPPNDEELQQFRQWSQSAKKFCDENQIIFAGYLQGVGDPLLWMSGIEPLIMASVMNPGFLKQYIDLVARWNRAILEILIDVGVDLVIRRGWYESTDFWAPDLFRQFLFEPLKKEIEIAHQAGVYFTYVMNSKAKPMLNIFKELGFDIYSNVDPITAGMDLSEIKKEIGSEITLYGGVNNFLVIENGTTEEVENAVAEAIEKLSSDGGFILGTGDALDYMFANPEVTKRNFYKMIEVWKKLR